jgi:hypothetical protein
MLSKSKLSGLTTHFKFCHPERSDAAQRGVAKSKDPENLPHAM